MTEHVTNSQLFQQELERMAVDTFETIDEAAQWLRNPHPLLDGRNPLQAAQTEAGAQVVKSILVAIKYGGVA
jgi:putative toxin-antitoxin system antitoxin component (TIGR02293 family)